MQKVNEFPKRQGYGSLPYDDLFDGSIWQLDPKDYDVQLETLRNRIWAGANRRGVKVHTETHEGQLFLQVVPNGSEQDS